jgi:hypothetical protein
MTCSEYIRQTFADFGVRLSDASLLGIAARGGLDPDAAVDPSDLIATDVAVVRAVPLLLLAPSSVSEGGLSVSRADRESILRWYSLRCRELGLEDVLSDRPAVRFM